LLYLLLTKSLVIPTRLLADSDVIWSGSTWISYAGDEGGIVCRLDFTREIETSKRQPSPRSPICASTPARRWRATSPTRSTASNACGTRRHKRRPPAHAGAEPSTGIAPGVPTPLTFSKRPRGRGSGPPPLLWTGLQKRSGADKGPGRACGADAENGRLWRRQGSYPGLDRGSGYRMTAVRRLPRGSQRRVIW
jgi:hypothetical protein